MMVNNRGTYIYTPVWELVLIYMYRNEDYKEINGSLISREIGMTLSLCYHILKEFEGMEIIDRIGKKGRRVYYRLNIDGKLLCESLEKIYSIMGINIARILEERKNENKNKKTRKR